MMVTSKIGLLAAHIEKDTDTTLDWAEKHLKKEISQFNLIVKELEMWLQRIKEYKEDKEKAKEEFKNAKDLYNVSSKTTQD